MYYYDYPKLNFRSEVHCCAFLHTIKTPVLLLLPLHPLFPDLYNFSWTSEIVAGLALVCFLASTSATWTRASTKAGLQAGKSCLSLIKIFFKNHWFCQPSQFFSGTCLNASLSYNSPILIHLFQTKYAGTVYRGKTIRNRRIPTARVNVKMTINRLRRHGDMC